MMLEPLSDGASLTEAIRAFILTHGLRDEIKQEQGPSGYTTWLRRRGPVRRHLLIRPLDGDFANQYGVVWGEYPAWEDCPDGLPGFLGFDGRMLGPPNFILTFFRCWMIDWLDRREVPRPDAAQR